MRLQRLSIGALAAFALACVIGSATLRAEPKTATAAKQVAATANKAPATGAQFATLTRVNAVPMAATELGAIKGQHVHFLDAGGGELHLAGNPELQNNWQNIGGSDGKPVAPSYNGLCVAAGYSGPTSATAISIPGGQFQCPL